jgi:hypothetical protein
MFASRPRLPGGPAALLVDLLVVAWTVVWIVLGVAVADAVKELTILSDTVSDAGRAVVESGRAFGALGDLPLVGEQVDEAARAIAGAGRNVVEEGDAARRNIVQAANLLGFAVALIPIASVLAAYLPPRVGRVLEAREVRRAVREGAGDPALERFLAQRAAVHLSYRELARVSRAPWRDLEEGRHRRLAEAELRRVGIGAGPLRGARRPR